MIPTFPQFKRLELSDRKAIKTYTQKYPPYSDFNFTSLWSWDTHEARMISKCNGNLVVLFTDYTTQEPFLSFLGESDVGKTARTLLAHSASHDLPKVLKLVPECAVRNLKSGDNLVATEDKNNFDYIYEISRLMSFSGRKFSRPRTNLNRFEREHPDAHVAIVDFAVESNRADMLAVLRLWERNKISQHKQVDVEHELHSIQRLCDTAYSHNLFVTGLYCDDAMKGFSLDEVLHHGYAICHFWKADVNSGPVFDYLARGKARLLALRGVRYLNMEQDLGILGLRSAKQAYSTGIFLKKYQVRPL